MPRPAEPLQLHHSWALWTSAERFELGLIADRALIERHMPPPGRWCCDLADQRLDWSTEVYRLFGLDEDIRPTRATAVAMYREGSRAAMERLRDHAIRHRRGFTIDVEIRARCGTERWMRLTAAPLCEGARVVRLHGLKQDVTGLYRRSGG